MNQLMSSDFVREMTYGDNFAYILASNDLFLSTEYKVLQNQTNSGFVKCVKLLYNGKIQLYYVVDSWQPMPVVLPNISPEDFVTLTANLISIILKTKDNGFLSCMNVNPSLDKIFVDPVTLKIKLVYIPSAKHLNSDNSAFEKQIRMNLLKVIDVYPNLLTPKTAALKADLEDYTLSLEGLCGKLMGTIVAPAKPVVEETKRNLRIVAMGAPDRIEYVVNKDHFVIGKGTAVDANADFNKSISRIHCAVDKVDGQYTITDLESTNGTFINGSRLQAKIPYPIKNGDILKLANSKFQIIL